LGNIGRRIGPLGIFFVHLRKLNADLSSSIYKEIINITIKQFEDDRIGVRVVFYGRR
jgi:hypothetical protein